MHAQDIVKGRYSTYQLQDLIGRGGNAMVYSAIDRSTGSVVAVKRMLARDDSAMTTWRKEVSIISSLEHPYIIRYLDHARTGKAFLIVMEYAPGGSLLQQLKRNERYGEREVARFMLQITSGLAYIHEKKFLHRDLKCSNVLLGAGDNVKLSDFGLAMSHGSVESDSVDDGSRDSGGDGENGLVSNPEEEAARVSKEGMVGSVYWMAPETIRGEPQNESSDIWSLGCLCIELLTGHPPFFNRAPANALYHIAESDEVPTPPIDVSEDCRGFLAQCLDRDPLKRQSAAGLMQHRWFGSFVAENLLEALVNAQTADISVEQVASNSAAIGHWVEKNLFSDRVGQREQWLKDGFLKKVVAVLPKVTAETSFFVIRTFAFAAQRCRTENSCFLTQLGETDLWDNAQLSLLGKVESLGSLFVCCCERQDPQVTQYTPTHPGAIRFLLQSPDVDIVIKCIDALRHLLVETPGEDDDAVGAFSLQQENTGSVPDRIRFRRFVSQKRFVSDRAVYAIQRIIEDACCMAFHEEREPLIGWSSVDKLFEILVQVHKKNGDESIIGGPSMTIMRKMDTMESSNGVSAPVSSSDISIAAGVVAEGGGRHSINTAAAAAAAAGGESNAGRGGTGANDIIDEVDGEKLVKERWLLALQEASQRLCPNAILLLQQYIHYAIRNGLNCLEVGGKSIAGTILIVASNALIDVAKRIALLKCLPLLQCASTKAALFIRDTKCSVPLLAHTAKSIVVPEESRDDEVLKVLFSLCDDERMAATCAASEAFLSIALDRARLAAERHRWAEVVLAIRFIEILLAHSVDTKRMVESRDLLQLLLCLSEGEHLPAGVNSVAQRLLNSLQAQTNVQ